MLRRSVGRRTLADGTQGALYAAPVVLPCQIQAASGDDLKQLDAMNIQGQHRSVYLFGSWAAVVRADQKGGDLIILPDSTIWLCTMSLEDWPGWCKLAITRQLNAVIIDADSDQFIIAGPA